MVVIIGKVLLAATTALVALKVAIDAGLIKPH